MLTMDYVANPMFAQDGMIFTGRATGRKYPLQNFKIYNVHPQDAAQFEAIRMFKVTPGQTKIEVAEEPVVAATQQPVTEISREERLARNNAWLEKQAALARMETEKEIEVIEEKLAEARKPKDIADLSLATIKEMDAKEPIKPATAAVMLAQEKSGKSRKTVIAWLEKHIT